MKLALLTLVVAGTLAAAAPIQVDTVVRDAAPAPDAVVPRDPQPAPAKWPFNLFPSMPCGFGRFTVRPCNPKPIDFTPPSTSCSFGRFDNRC